MLGSNFDSRDGGSFSTRDPGQFARVGSSTFDHHHHSPTKNDNE